MDNFENILLRLKTQLLVQTDKEVAEALGLSIKAFTARKMRNSFPVDKLLALKVSRPELNVDYVISGNPSALVAADLNQAKREILEYTKTLGEVYGVSDIVDQYELVTDRSKRLVTWFEQLDEQSKVAIELMVNTLLTNRGSDKRN